MTWLETPVHNLAKVGPRYLACLKRLGILTAHDLLRHFPHRYEDLSQTMSIADIIAQAPELAEQKTPVNIIGTVAEIEAVRLWRSKRYLVKATIVDESDDIQVTWFNQPYIVDVLKVGTTVSLAGKLRLDKQGLQLSNPSYEKIDVDEVARLNDQYNLTHTGRLIPVYPETEGISSKYLRFLIKPLLGYVPKLPDPLPESLIKKYDLPSLAQALRDIHFPATLEAAERARRRMAFEDLLVFQLRALTDRRKLAELKAPVMPFDKKAIADLVSHLPFALTDDQRIATYEILKDLEKPSPMNRLLNGDVGSGKTVVALIGAYQTMLAGYQAVMMVPTEILAKQHFETARKIFADRNVRVGLLTSSEARQWPIDPAIEDEKISKKLMYDKIGRHQLDLIIGTHAVIQDKLNFPKLGLVAIDEQHRFGVKQRMKLAKNERQGTRDKRQEADAESETSDERQGVSSDQQTVIPHLLSMTATPIPRTLALTIYGDLDISFIKQKPKGRLEIVTKVVHDRDQDKAHAFVRKLLQQGRQVFVICPRIEASKAEETNQVNKQASIRALLWAEVKAVEEEHQKLQQEVFPDFRVVMLHGKMKPDEKNQIMNNFRDHHYDILVSTSVIEVGVDVPNAAVMLIRSAERFGLSQLHQFRGRVGRGQHQSYCLLLSPSANSARLKALEKTANGFQLAEIDLKLRGPGEFVGTKQSGIPDLVMDSLGDIELIKRARDEAKLILETDPHLIKNPALSQRVSDMERIVHFE